MHQLTGFEITDISANKWEGINYHIHDYENNSIEFYCSQVHIEQ